MKKANVCKSQYIYLKFCATFRIAVGVALVTGVIHVNVISTIAIQIDVGTIDVDPDHAIDPEENITEEAVQDPTSAQEDAKYPNWKNLSHLTLK